MKRAPRRLIIGLVILIALVVIALAALGFFTPQPLQNTAPVQRGDISANVSATGKVQPKKTAKLSLPQSGTVASISKVEGDEVNTGDVILALRADDANRRVKQAELNLQNRQLDLTRTQAAPSDTDIEIARANLQKATIAAAAADAAYTASATAQNDAARQATRADLDIARANFDRTVNGPTSEELNALKNTVTSAQLDLETAKAALAQTQVTAPYTSTVTEIDVHEGELVGGFNQLAAVADLKTLQITAEIDEIDVAHVQVGQAAQVRLDAFPGEQFDGKLTRLFPSASTARGTTVYNAIVEFDPRGLGVRPGMGASLKIQTIEKKAVLLVPNGALKSVGQRKAIHIAAPGQPRDVIVETGVTDGNNTEIVSGEVKEGDQVSLQ